MKMVETAAKVEARQQMNREDLRYKAESYRNAASKQGTQSMELAARRQASHGKSQHHYPKPSCYEMSIEPAQQKKMLTYH